MVGTSIHSNGGDLYSPHSNARWRATYVLHILSQVQSGTAMYIQVQPCDIQNVLHYGPEATSKKKSTGRSESSSDKTMTSPVTDKNFKIGPLGDFEKTYVFYVAMAEKPLSSPNSDESLYLGNGTSDHRNEKTKTLCNRKYPPKT